MSQHTKHSLTGLPVTLAAIPMLGLLALPFVALLMASSPMDILAGMRQPLFLTSLLLSAKTTAISLAITIVAGTPLAWWLAAAPPRQTKAAELLVDLPIILPPAVVGIALLQLFGRNGLWGHQLELLNLQIPFTTFAVVLAQVVVSAPFYIQASAAAFRRVDQDLLLVARTLGQSPSGAFLRVAIPVALPGMLGGATLAWARALGEFGATLVFAGNLPGRTQTVPLAIYAALESDVRAALALSLVLAAAGIVILFALRTGPKQWIERQTNSKSSRINDGGR